MTEQGNTYSTFVASVLVAENDRRKDINAQAAKAITGSGAQFTLVTAVIIFVKGKDYSPALHWGSWAFALALALYLLSVCFGLVASQSHKTPVTSTDTLTRMLTDHWTDDEVTAKNIVAVAQILEIPQLRQGNEIKATWLKRSVIIQVLAIAALLFGAVSLFF